MGKDKRLGPTDFRTYFQTFFVCRLLRYFFCNWQSRGTKLAVWGKRFVRFARDAMTARELLLFFCFFCDDTKGRL